MFESALRWIFIGASALAAGLGGYVILSAVVNFAQWIYQRRRPSWFRQLEKQRRTLPTLAVKQNNLGRVIVLGAALGLAFKAAVTGGVLVAVFLSAVGVALYVYLGSRSTSMAREQITDAVAELIAAYYSAYLVIPTVFGALTEASKTQTNAFLQSAVQRALYSFSTASYNKFVKEYPARK